MRTDLIRRLRIARPRVTRRMQKRLRARGLARLAVALPHAARVRRRRPKSTARPRGRGGRECGRPSTRYTYGLVRLVVVVEGRIQNGCCTMVCRKRVCVDCKNRVRDIRGVMSTL